MANDAVQNHKFTHKYLYQCDSQTDCTSIKLELSKGTYFFELWGAQGGNSSDVEDEKGKGGKGGYVNALIRLYEDTLFYINIGAHGEKPDTDQKKSQTDLSFNGGGYGTNYNIDSDIPRFGCSGGGATDVRYQSNDIQSRILIASGGGGASFTNTAYKNGGNGGGTTVICPEDISESVCDSKQPTQEFNGESPSDDIISAGGGGGYLGGVVYGGYGSPASGGTSYICQTDECQKYILKGKIYESNEERPDFYHKGILTTGHIGNGAISIIDLQCSIMYRSINSFHHYLFSILIASTSKQ